MVVCSPSEAEAVSVTDDDVSAKEEGTLGSALGGPDEAAAGEESQGVASGGSLSGRLGYSIESIKTS